MTIKRAWKLDPEPFHNQGFKLVALGAGGLAPAAMHGIQQQLDAGEFEVAIDRVTVDVEDIDRNVVTEADLTYQVISNGQDVYLIEV